MYGKKQWIQIHQLSKLGITSTVSETGVCPLRHLRSNVLKQHIIRVNYLTLI